MHPYSNAFHVTMSRALIDQSFLSLAKPQAIYQIKIFALEGFCFIYNTVVV